MNDSLFDSADYKVYLRTTEGSWGRGFRKAVAQACQCQTAYVSHVLNGTAHFSLEQADVISRLLAHSREEANFFLLLVDYTRAGTASLKQRLKENLHEAREKHLSVKDRIKIQETISPLHQATYYSSWIYSVIHVALTIPFLQTKESISRHLGLPVATVSQVLDFLVSIGLVLIHGGKYQISTAHIHLEKDSPLNTKHHINWRLQAIRALEQQRSQDLHHSSVFSVSTDDAEKIRSLFVTSIQQAVAVITPSPGERIFSLGLDFFEILK